MRVLLDTQSWLWWQGPFDLLSPGAREIITSARDPLYLSVASSWEIAIKWSLGKLKLPQPPALYLPARLAEDGISALAIENVHALQVAELPPLHADPFDRLLVAQAQVERMTLLTADPQIVAYDVEILWAGEGPLPRRRGRRRR